MRSRGNRAVYLGQGGYKNGIENTLLQLAYARDRGFGGTVFYSYRQPNTNGTGATLAAIRERQQPEWTDVPTLPWKTGRAVLRGTVTRGVGREPVYNASVTVEERTVRTEAHGGYAFFDLLPGEREIKVEVRGEKGQSKRVEVRAGKVETMDFVFQPRIPLSGTDEH